MTFLVHIDGHEHRVARDAIETLRTRILDAVHAGGRFVDLPNPARNETVLVTPNTSVWIEAEPEPITAEHADEPGDIVYLQFEAEL